MSADILTAQHHRRAHKPAELLWGILIPYVRALGIVAKSQRTNRCFQDNILAMLSNRRYDRVKADESAVISFNDGKNKIACVIQDVSDGGVGLSVTSTVAIPDQFTLKVTGEEEGRACTVRWRAGDKLGASFDVEPVHWMTGAGGLAVACGVAIGVMLFSLPAFEGARMAGFWFVAAPMAVVGVSMLLFQRYWRNKRN